MPDRIEKTTDLNAPIDTVWDAITDHEKFGAWFKVKLYTPFRQGEVTKGHITYPGVEGMDWESLTTAIRPNTYFAMIWYHDDIAPEGFEGRLETLVEFKLEGTGSGTRLTIVESGFDSFPASLSNMAWRRNEEGWTIQSRNIAEYVDG